MISHTHRIALFTGILTALVLLCRNAILLVLYSFAFYPDSDTYVHLGKTFFEIGVNNPLVMFPYPLLNALTHSYQSPTILIWVQMCLAAAAGGFFVYVIGRKNLVFALVLGIFFLFDLVWGSLSRVLLTDGLFATFFMFCLAILVWHFDRRDQLKVWELFLSGLLFAFTCIIRPSHAFLVILLPFIYLWLTRSWIKTLILSLGLLAIFLVVGLINWRGSGKFYIFASGTSYTDVNTAFPLFVYGLFSPENGPVSSHLDEAIQSCYPGLDYQASVQRSEGGDVDSPQNMDFVHRKIVPCLTTVLGVDGLKSQFPRAYLEAVKSQPGRFFRVMYQENVFFLSYNNPYILREYCTASENYMCTDFSWCKTIRAAHYEWTTGSPGYVLYEKAATKIFQAYLAPIGILSRLSPEKIYLPYAIAWSGMIVFFLLFGRGRNLFLAVTTSMIILYTSMVVIAGHGFVERYAVMLSPLQTTLSAIVYYTLAEQLVKVFRRWKKPKLS